MDTTHNLTPSQRIHQKFSRRLAIRNALAAVGLGLVAPISLWPVRERLIRMFNPAPDSPIVEFSTVDDLLPAANPDPGPRANIDNLVIIIAGFVEDPAKTAEHHQALQMCCELLAGEWQKYKLEIDPQADPDRERLLAECERKLAENAKLLAEWRDGAR